KVASGQGNVLIASGSIRFPNSDPARGTPRRREKDYGALRSDRRSVLFRSATLPRRTPRRHENGYGVLRPVRRSVLSTVSLDGSAPRSHCHHRVGVVVGAVGRWGQVADHGELEPGEVLEQQSLMPAAQRVGFGRVVGQYAAVAEMVGRAGQEMLDVVRVLEDVLAQL